MTGNHWKGALTVIGVIVVVIVAGLLTGFVKTRASADALTEERVAGAIVDGYARICAARFEADSSADVAALQEMAEADRAAHLAEGGWATMPGDDEPVDGVAAACASRLVEGA